MMETRKNYIGRSRLEPRCVALDVQAFDQSLQLMITGEGCGDQRERGGSQKDFPGQAIGP